MRIDGVKWVRVLYCYPDRVTDELLETMAAEEKIVKYMDIPIQHVSGRILNLMNRRGDAGSLAALMQKIREKVPGVVLRTTLITGFPTETEEEFTELCEFIRKVKFERLGCFAYSQEEDTPRARWRIRSTGGEGTPCADRDGGAVRYHGSVQPFPGGQDAHSGG